MYVAGRPALKVSSVVGSRRDTGKQAGPCLGTAKQRPRADVKNVGGPWPIFFLGPDELVAGRDNQHMDFRLSIMKVRDGNGPSVVLSTLCMVHNRFGRYYLSSITPFHKFCLRILMASAVAADRL